MYYYLLIEKKYDRTRIKGVEEDQDEDDAKVLFEIEHAPDAHVIAVTEGIGVQADPDGKVRVTL